MVNWIALEFRDLSTQRSRRLHRVHRGLLLSAVSAKSAVQFRLVRFQSFSPQVTQIIADAGCLPGSVVKVDEPKPNHLDLASAPQFRFDLHRRLCIGLCMKFKTISLSEDAYKILKKAKRSRRESFTEVVKRASWDEPAETMGQALDLLESEFGHGKTTVTAEELETSRKLHAERKARA